MEIVFLGTNGWYDSATGNTVCALVRTRRYDIVLDAGNGLCKLDKYIDGKKPVVMLLSHFHLDHIAGLHTLVKLRLRGGLTICAGKGARRILGKFINSPFTVPLQKLPYPVKILELPAERKRLPFRISTLPLEHADPVLGFRLELDGKVLTYCTDTGYCPNALELARGADLLITECAHLPGETNPGWPHFNPETAGRLAQEAGAKRLVLTHFSAARYTAPALRAMALRQARKIFPATAAASDGLKIPIMIHYYGALAPRSPLRPLLVAKAVKETDRLALREKVNKLKKKAKSWAACLARVFEVFPLICPKCKLEMKPVAVILNDKELVRLLTHLGLPAEFPKFKPAPQASLYEHACGPPDEDCQLDPLVDYEAVEPAPADD